MRDQIFELCQAAHEIPSHFYFESGSLDTLMRMVDCTSCMTIIPEMALEFIPMACQSRVKTIAKGVTSRRVALAVSRTYVKQSIVEALRKTILECVNQEHI